MITSEMVAKHPEVLTLVPYFTFLNFYTLIKTYWYIMLPMAAFIFGGLFKK